MEKTIIRVHQIAAQAQNDKEPLLSRYSGAFWIPYLASYTDLDRIFSRMYESFKYIVHTPKLSNENMLENFRADVKALLLTNNKKYTELFRLENLDDEVYNILDNYDLTETMNKTTGNTRNENIGERNDTDTLTMTGTDTMKIDGTDTNTIGETNTDTMVSNPDVTTTRENTVSAFDSDEYSPREKNTETVGSHEIDTVTHEDEHIDSLSTDRTNTETRDMTDSRAVTTGAQNNNVIDSGTEEYSLRRKGNIGVMTQSDVLAKHLELWDSYAFYQKIFADIADLLLYV